MLKIKSLLSSSTFPWLPTYLCPWQSIQSSAAVPPTPQSLFCLTLVLPRDWMECRRVCIESITRWALVAVPVLLQLFVKRVVGLPGFVLVDTKTDINSIQWPLPGSVMKSSQRVEGKSSSIKYHSLLITHPCSSSSSAVDQKRHWKEWMADDVFLLLPYSTHPLPHSAV